MWSQITIKSNKLREQREKKNNKNQVKLAQ